MHYEHEIEYDMRAAVSWYLLSGFHAAGHQPGHGTTTPNPSSLSLYRTSRRVWQQVTCLERFSSVCFHPFSILPLLKKASFPELLRGTVQKRPFVRMLHSAHRIASWPKAFWSEGQALTNLNCTLIYILHWYTCILDLHSASFIYQSLRVEVSIGPFSHWRVLFLQRPCHKPLLACWRHSRAEKQRLNEHHINILESQYCIWC